MKLGYINQLLLVEVLVLALVLVMAIAVLVLNYPPMPAAYRCSGGV